jgi:hypothetical protein
VHGRKLVKLPNKYNLSKITILIINFINAKINISLIFNIHFAILYVDKLIITINLGLSI